MASSRLRIDKNLSYSGKSGTHKNPILLHIIMYIVENNDKKYHVNTQFRSPYSTILLPKIESGSRFNCEPGANCPTILLVLVVYELSIGCTSLSIC